MITDHTRALPQGARLEQYRLDTAFGADEFEITCRAYDGDLDTFVILKEYLPDFAIRTEAGAVEPKSSAQARDYYWGLEQFLEQGRALARLDHPHLNKVLRSFEANGTAYLVLEYIEGETLAARLERDSRLSEEALRRVLEESLSGLEALHEAGHIHRDVKPGNLLLRAGDGGVVALGFAAARQALARRRRCLNAALTPGYAPLEQYDSALDRAGVQTDLYALGMVAYRCLSGVRDEELPDAVARKLAQSGSGTGLAAALEAGRGHYDAAFLEAVDWAIQVDEDARPRQASEWRAALAGGAVRGGAPVFVRKEVERPARAARSERSRGERAWMSGSRVALALVLTVLTGAILWQGWQLYRGVDEAAVSDTPALATTPPPVTADAKPPPAAPQEPEPEPEAGTEEAAPAEDIDVAQSSPAAEAPAHEEDEVVRLLAEAEEDLKARRLTSPADNNAWDKYQRVLELDPLHAQAMAGMERVLESYLELFEAALGQGDYDQAADYLQRIRDLHPDSPLLQGAERKLAAARQAQAGSEAQREVAAVKPVCDRTPAVRDAIMAQFPELECGAVTQEALASMKALTVREEGLELQEGDFSGLDSLEELDLADNRMSALPSGIFSGLASLANLILSNNQLTSLAEQAFSGLASLVGLDLSDNQISKFTKVALKGLTSLEKLDLSDNRMSELPEGAVSGLTSLQSIALAGNPLSPAGKARIERELGALGEKTGNEITVEFISQAEQERAHAAELERREAEAQRLVGEMVLIPGGSFQMGDLSGEGDDDEKPVHRVTVPAFRLGKHEVTFAQWDACVADGGCWGYRPDDEGWGRGNRPVMNVSWDDAQSFIRWLNGKTGGGYRLPAESEWEYAARAGTSTKYHVGNSISSGQANFDESGHGKTVPVGSYSANGWGLHDMHGNVYELVQDCWNDSYRGAPGDGSAWESGNCTRRVGRGGSWDGTARYLRSANRYWRPRSNRDSSQGFRLARDASPRAQRHPGRAGPWIPSYACATACAADSSLSSTLSAASPSPSPPNTAPAP